MENDKITNAHEIIKTFIEGMFEEINSDEDDEMVKTLKKLKFVTMEVLEDCLCDDCLKKIKNKS